MACSLYYYANSLHYYDPNVNVDSTSSSTDDIFVQWIEWWKAHGSATLKDVSGSVTAQVGKCPAGL